MGNFEGLLCFPLLPSKWSISGVQEFKNSRIQEFQKPESRNSGILELQKYTILKAYSVFHFYLQNCTFGEFKNSRIPESGIPEFWNSGTPEMGHFEGLLCVPLLPSKWLIFGVLEFQNSGILELRKWTILKSYSVLHFWI